MSAVTRAMKRSRRSHSEIVSLSRSYLLCRVGKHSIEGSSFLSAALAFLESAGISFPFMFSLGFPMFWCSWLISSSFGGDVAANLAPVMGASVFLC